MGSQFPLFSPAMSNIHGFGSSKKSDPDSDSEGGGKPPGKGLPPRQDYVGSGLNVQQPKKMVRIALKFPPTSAIPAHPHPHATCTLQVDDVMKLQGGPAGTKGEFKMEYWKNGIRMGDSTTLIPFDSPDGKEIMAAVASQRVPIKFMPPELQQKAAAGDVFVEMSDHREEGDYKAPPPQPTWPLAAAAMPRAWRRPLPLLPLYRMAPACHPCPSRPASPLPSSRCGSWMGSGLL